MLAAHWQRHVVGTRTDVRRRDERFSGFSRRVAREGMGIPTVTVLPLLSGTKAAVFAVEYTVVATHFQKDCVELG